MAHIVADSRQGPRGNSTVPDADRNKYPNLILLCTDHHTIIDGQPLTYSVSVLRQMKVDHEGRIAQQTAAPPPTPSKVLRQETIRSTLLPVTHLPSMVFAAPCAFVEQQVEEVRQRIIYPRDRRVLVPFLLRDRKLFAFQDLRASDNPFASVIDQRHVEPLRVPALCHQAEGKRRYVALLNLAVSRFLGQFRVRYDSTHKRYYFMAEEVGKRRSVQYRTLSGLQRPRDVVWQPKKRTTGEVRDFWWHLAVALKFHSMADDQWCLTIRPERHLTEDGETPLPSHRIGRRVTRLKARMFNDKYLSEVHFWRDFLSRGKPRIILDFGSQSVVIEAELRPFTVEWPGIPADDKPYTHEAPADDLFSWADLHEATSGESSEGEEAAEDDWWEEDNDDDE